MRVCEKYGMKTRKTPVRHSLKRDEWSGGSRVSTIELVAFSFVSRALPIDGSQNAGSLHRIYSIYSTTVRLRPYIYHRISELLLHHTSPDQERSLVFWSYSTHTVRQWTTTTTKRCKNMCDDEERETKQIWYRNMIVMNNSIAFQTPTHRMLRVNKKSYD